MFVTFPPEVSKVLTLTNLLFIIFWSQVTINDEVIGTSASYPGSTFNTFGVKVSKVHTLTLESVGLGDHDWISFLEVLSRLQKGHRWS